MPTCAGTWINTIWYLYPTPNLPSTSWVLGIYLVAPWGQVQVISLYKPGDGMGDNKQVPQSQKFLVETAQGQNSECSHGH